MKKYTLTLFLVMVSILKIESPTIGACVDVSITLSKQEKGGLKKFLNVLSKRESRNRQGIVSKNGHLGKYQFSQKTLEWIGFDVNIEEFLGSSKMQDDAMIKYLKVNKRILRRIIKKWDNEVIDGYEITESGILAAAHLVGPGGVLKFFNKGITVTDSNDIKITDYLFRYSGYELNL